MGEGALRPALPPPPGVPGSLRPPPHRRQAGTATAAGVRESAARAGGCGSCSLLVFKAPGRWWWCCLGEGEGEGAPSCLSPSLPRGSGLSPQKGSGAVRGVLVRILDTCLPAGRGGGGAGVAPPAAPALLGPPPAPASRGGSGGASKKQRWRRGLPSFLPLSGGVGGAWLVRGGLIAWRGARLAGAEVARGQACWGEGAELDGGEG